MKAKTILVVLLVLIVLFFSAMPLCSAWTLVSTNYNISISNINFGCYDKHSASYNIDYSLVDQYVGWNNTNNFNVTFGFYGAVNYTGYSVGGPFDISIDAPASVTASSTATATVQLTNQNPDFGEDVLVSYWITNTGGSTVASGSKTVYVGALSTATTSVSLTAPSSAGNCVYHAMVTWSTTYTATATDSFTVTAAPAAGEEPPGGGGGTPRVPVLRIIDYPDSIIMGQDDFEYFIVKVKNIGEKKATETFLRILNLSQQCFVSVVPESAEIEPNSTANYVFELRTREDAEPGAYDFTVRAVSGSVSHEVDSVLNIVRVIPDMVRIKDVQVIPDVLQANHTGTVHVLVRSNKTTSTNVTVELLIPYTWKIEENNITKSVGPGEETAFNFTVLPETEGTFEFIVSMTYDGKKESRAVAVAVEFIREEEQLFLDMITLIISLIITVFLFGLVLIVLLCRTSDTKSQLKKIEERESKVAAEIAKLRKLTKKTSKKGYAKVKAEMKKELQKERKIHRLHMKRGEEKLSDLKTELNRELKKLKEEKLNLKKQIDSSRKSSMNKIEKLKKKIAKIRKKK